MESDKNPDAAQSGVAVNPAPAESGIHRLIQNRWSPRAYTDRKVDRAAIDSLLEAARWAPSCYNEQPWFFLVAAKEDAAEYEKMLYCLVEANQKWARLAPVLMISVAKLFFQKNGKPNRHAQHDVGLASENMALQAAALGLALHQMAGFDVEKTREVYSIPEGYEPMAAIAVGYAGSPDLLPPELAEREKAPRVRRKTEEFAFTGAWNRAYRK